jgi:hypothetical protein
MNLVGVQAVGHSLNVTLILSNVSTKRTRELLKLNRKQLR